jgi:hypothetical protein
MPDVIHGKGLYTWYGSQAEIHKATLNVPSGRHFLSPGEPYPAGTEVYVYCFDPERPDMVDVELPNGDLLRKMKSDVTCSVCGSYSHRERV